MMHGNGTLVGADGTVYKGEFSNNLPHGRGRVEKSDGWGFDGQTVNGKAHGVGKCRDPEGEWRRCEVQDGNIIRWLD